ncbi:hypothetical protein [Streptomyces harbinensis]
MEAIPHFHGEILAADQFRIPLNLSGCFQIAGYLRGDELFSGSGYLSV